MNAAAPGVPTRPLLALTGLVGLLHLLALQGAPESLGIAMEAPRRPLQVRAVVPPVAAPEPAVVETPGARPHADAAPVTPVPTRARPAARTVAAESAPLATSPPAPPAPGTALAWPAPARWTYLAKASRRGIALEGAASLAWQLQDGRYEAVLALQVPGLPDRLQRSEGQLGPQGLAPLRYADRTRSELAAHFDAPAGRVVFSSNRPAAPLAGGAQDRVSVLLQLAAMAAADAARLAAGNTISVQVVGAREADDWTFTSEGEEALALPSGEVRALKLSRAPQREYDLRLEAWFLPGRAYGPVRLRLTLPNGDWLDLLASGTDKG